MGDHQVYLLGLNCRLSPRRKTERDVPETDGTGGRRRRMSLRGKAKTDGPSFAEIDGSDGRVSEKEC